MLYVSAWATQLKGTAEVMHGTFDPKCITYNDI